jgi:hypothetical protein
VRLESALVNGAAVRARWDDGAPFLIERQLGHGILISAGLPSSPDESDFALRPAFLSFLHHVLSLAREQSGQRRGVPGMPFRFPAQNAVQVLGPDGGPLSPVNDGAAERAQTLFTPDFVGRYRVRAAEGDSERIVAFDPSELRDVPHPPDGDVALPNRSGGSQKIDVSPEIARIVVALIALELAVRLVRLLRRRALDSGAKSPQSSKMGSTSRA